jgi:predicted nucleic acid-binding protein
MIYLIDTNVVSELRKSRNARLSGKVDGNVLAWARSVPADSQFLSVISILEIETGALLMERRDPRQGAALRHWLENHVLSTFAGRILPVDTAVARKCASLHVPDPKAQRDALIAATALVHGMTVVTRNVADFDATGVALLNPWLHSSSLP